MDKGTLMTNTCNNCFAWDRNNDFGGSDIPSLPIGARRCLHPKVGGGAYGDLAHEAPDAANSFDCLGTGPEFGCVHFELHAAAEK